MNPGDVVHFTFELVSTSNDGPLWTATLSSCNGQVSSSFTLPSSIMTMALFAVELYGTTYNFGPTVYDNVVMTAVNPASEWCYEYSMGYYSNTGTWVTGNADSRYLVDGVVFDGNTCRINSIFMPSRTIGLS